MSNDGGAVQQGSSDFKVPDLRMWWVRRSPEHGGDVQVFGHHVTNDGPLLAFHTYSTDEQGRPQAHCHRGFNHWNDFEEVALPKVSGTTN